LEEKYQADYGFCEVCCREAVHGSDRRFEEAKEYLYLAAQGILMAAKYFGIVLFGLFALVMILFPQRESDEDDGARKRREEDEEMDRKRYMDQRERINSIHGMPDISHEDDLREEALLKEVNGLVRDDEPADALRAADELLQVRIRLAEDSKRKSYNEYKDALWERQKCLKEADEDDENDRPDDAQRKRDRAEDLRYEAEDHYKKYLSAS
jgi:hypothetical protein